jgi:hypothetical protein
MAFQYAIGVEFAVGDETQRNRIVGMVQRIEQYRRDAEQGGRRLSAQDAALEWIRLFGEKFFSKA